MADTLNIVADACLEMLVSGLTHKNEDRLHWMVSFSMNSSNCA